MGQELSQWATLDLLLEQPAKLWGIGELVDALGSPATVAEALDALHAAGLIECTGEFVRLAP